MVRGQQQPSRRAPSSAKQQEASGTPRPAALVAQVAHHELQDLVLELHAQHRVLPKVNLPVGEGGGRAVLAVGRGEAGGEHGAGRQAARANHAAPPPAAAVAPANPHLRQLRGVLQPRQAQVDELLRGEAVLGDGELLRRACARTEGGAGEAHRSVRGRSGARQRLCPLCSCRPCFPPSHAPSRTHAHGLQDLALGRVQAVGGHQARLHEQAVCRAPWECGWKGSWLERWVQCRCLAAAHAVRAASRKQHPPLAPAGLPASMAPVASSSSPFGRPS